MPVLANEAMHDALRTAWTGAQQWSVGAYMIMPDHVHLFSSPAVHEHEAVQQWVGFWKRAVGRQWRGQGSLWQRDCWDTQLRRSESYSDKYEYVRQNPVRAELVDNAGDWPYQGVMNVLRW